MPAQLASTKVLLVEDQFFMRSLWRTILKSLGIREVYDAGTVQEAMSLMKKETFHLAIVDYHLGADGNGADFIRQIRAMDDTGAKLLSLIGCTSDGRPEIISDLANAGAHAMILKPVSAEAARSRIQSVLNRRHDQIRRGINRASGRPDDCDAPETGAAAAVAARK